MLPIFQSDSREMTMLQTQWASQLNPLLTTPFQPSLLTGIVLNTGTNTINHKLGRTMQGWFVTDINKPITVYRSQPFNDKTLTLTASAGATVNLAVY